MSLQPLTLGRSLILANNLFYSVGGYAADWSPTHVFNPRWPPHARFHNGQTMSTGLVACLLSGYYLFRTPPTATQSVKGNDSARKIALKDSLFTAAMIGSIYTVTGLSAILYPGAKGTDPEFGEGFPQGYLFAGSLVVNWVGWWLENRKLSAR